MYSQVAVVGGRRGNGHRRRRKLTLNPPSRRRHLRAKYMQRNGLLWTTHTATLIRWQNIEADA